MTNTALLPSVLLAKLRLPLTTHNPQGGALTGRHTTGVHSGGVGGRPSGHERQSDDPRTCAVLHGPAERHDNLRPALGIILPRHHLVSTVVKTRCRHNGA